MDSETGEISLLLNRLGRGDRDAEALLVPLVYGELRRIATQFMRTERRDHTLEPTAVVHEAYFRLFHNAGIEWQGRAHFYAVAARLMRNILVDHARKSRAAKRGRKVSISLSSIEVASKLPVDLLEIDKALDKLAAWDARQCKIVEMRFFGGLSNDEVAHVLGVSSRTVKRDWSMAKAWLMGEIGGDPGG